MSRQLELTLNWYTASVPPLVAYSRVPSWLYARPMPMKFCAGLALTMTNCVAPVTRLSAVTPSSGSVPARLTPGTAGTGRPLPQPSSLLAAHLPLGATARPREKSPRLYWSPAGRTNRPVGRSVAPCGTAAGAALVPACAVAAWGAEYAVVDTQAAS